MYKFRKLSALALLTTTVLALTACGGTETESKSSNNTSHPEFSWAKVAVSNNFRPSGDITDLTPTFSWKAVSGASVYNFGHEFTKGGEWKEYTVPAAEAGCATGLVCNYKPANHIFNVGEQKAWWVRGKINNSWQDWSSPHVFKIVDGSGGGSTTTPITVSPKNTQIVRDDSPWFSWEPVQNAKSLVLGLEKQDGTKWESYTINAKGNCPPTSSCPKTTFRPYKNFEDGDYTWWIRAEKQDGSWTNWSNGADFTINTSGTGGGNSLKALTPTGTINTTQPTFTWTKQNGASDYQIGFDAGTDWKTFSVSAGTINCTSNCAYTPTNTGLTAGNDTTWYVRAKVNSRWSNWTSGTRFNITQVPPTNNNRPFIIKVDTSKRTINYPSTPTTPAKTFIIDTNNNYNYNYNVDCNSDGTFEAINLQARYVCEYGSHGIYTISITGNYPAIEFKNIIGGRRTTRETNARKLIDVIQWGDQKWQSMSYAFERTANLQDITATDNPDLSRTTTLNNMFTGSAIRSLNQGTNNWDITNITDISGMFIGARSFNQDIGHWNTANVSNFRRIFSSADAFNQDISNWNTSKATNMSSMFGNAKAFNQSIGTWDTSKVTDMSYMFSGADAFKQPIGNWDTSHVTNMSEMFSKGHWQNQNHRYNPDITNWNTSNVTDMSSMFKGNNTFNQDISQWDVSKVVNIGGMFSETKAFNQDINDWDVGNVKFMASMFEKATAFNQSLGNWDVSNVYSMSRLFSGAKSFNRSLANWDVSNVEWMTEMFKEATNFDQDLGNWNVSEVKQMNEIFNGIKLSTNNYDSLLNGWSQLPLYSGNTVLVIKLDAGNSKYSSASAAARQKIIDDFNWNIIDGGML